MAFIVASSSARVRDRLGPVAWTLALVALVAPTIAHAQACPTGNVVRVELRGRWAEPVRRGVLADLEAELTPHGIAICEGHVERALAEVVLEPAVEPSVRVSIEVRDALTEKRVARDVNLEGVPDEGRPLTLALAVTELLRATWSELALESAAPREAPPEVRAMVRPAEPEVLHDLSASFVLEHASGGLTQMGGALRYQRWLVEPLAVAVSLGARGALPMVTTIGSIDATVFSAGLGARLATSRDRLRVGVDVGATVLLVRFQGHGAMGTAGRDVLDVAISVRAAAFAIVHVEGPLSLEASVGLGVPVLGLVATDGSQRLGGIEGVELALALGPTLSF
jgi:hypothetical protein